MVVWKREIKNVSISEFETSWRGARRLICVQVSNSLFISNPSVTVTCKEKVSVHTCFTWLLFNYSFTYGVFLKEKKNLQQQCGFKMYFVLGNTWSSNLSFSRARLQLYSVSTRVVISLWFYRSYFNAFCHICMLQVTERHYFRCFFPYQSQQLTGVKGNSLKSRIFILKKTLF